MYADQFPLFDLPLRFPYWSARNEADPQDPTKYRETDRIWEYYVDLLGKPESKGDKIFNFQPEFKKFYDTGQLTLIPISSEMTNAQKVVFIYDLMQQNAYLKDSKDPRMKLDQVIQAFANIAVIKTRRQMIEKVCSALSDRDLKRISKVAQQILKSPFFTVTADHGDSQGCRFYL